MEESQSKLTKKGTPITEFASRLTKEDADELGKRWLVLRNKTRLRIIDLLNRYEGLLCVTEIADVLQESTSAMLRAANLVETEKYQHYVYYRIKATAFDSYWNYLEGFL